MNEFITKLIERLEEEKNTAYKTYETFEMKVDLGRAFGIEKSMDIVNQLAEEYNQEHDDTDYANIELYAFWQKHQWIPCSERLPKPFERVLVTYLGYHDNKPYSNGATAFIDETGGWCWVKGSHYVNVPIIAWRENSAPYQPKGESSISKMENVDWKQQTMNRFERVE